MLALIPYIAPNVFAALVTLIIAIYCFRHRTVPMAVSMGLLVLCGSLWCIIYTLEIVTIDFSLKVFWAKARFIPLAPLASALLVMAIQNGGYGCWLRRGRWLLLAIVPAVIIVLSLTSGSHKLFRYDYRLFNHGALSLILFTNGPWYWVQFYYSQIACVVSFVLLFAAFIKGNPIKRRQTAFIGLGIVFVDLVNILFQLDITPVPHYNMAVPAQVVSSSMIFFAVFYYRALDIAPITREMVMNSISDVILVVDEKGCLLDMNRSARETFGLTLMMLEQRAADVLPQLAEYLGDGSQTAATSGEISLSAGGQTRAFDVSVQDVRFRERLVVGRLIRLHDITERRRADEAVRENERRIRILFDSLDDAIFVHDIPDGAIVDVNERAIEMYDYSRDEILHLTIGELSAGETPYSEEDARERLRRAMEGQRQTFEWLARDKEGKLFWTEVTMRLTSVLGKEQILSSVHDIGKRKKAEVKLLRTMKELEAFNSAMVGREQRMIELKQEINALMPELGRPPRYRIPHDPEPSDNPQPQTNVQPVQFVQSSKEKEKDSDGNNM